ncbi:phage major tail tube protein, partial [Acinetobacter nosocomialis]|uniref:phage major tail tube protein n=1 Tax=Acinetobacter nosocomialis TaxID=106654 RepID=UPI003AF8B1B3
SYLGQTGEVTLPKLTRKLENWRGGGLNCNIKWDAGLADDANEMTWKIGGIDKLILQQWEAATIGAIGLRFAGSYQREDTVEDIAVEIVIRGRH